MKRIFLFVLLVCSFEASFSEQLSINNHFDENGKKDGFWIEKFSEYWVQYVYYVHGVQHGIVRGFNTHTSQLDFIGELSQGKMVGTWLYFDDNNHLLMRCDDFNDSNTLIPIIHRYTIKYAPNNCHCVCYHSNGRIKKEGRLFFFEDPQMDDSGEYGTWQYYNEDGCLIETVLFE